MRHALSSIITAIQDNDNFLVVSHLGPDGDAIGSQIAMGCILKKTGKNFCLYNGSGLPDVFNWVNPSLPFISNFSELDGFKPDVCIFLDCGESSRAGEELENHFRDNFFNLSLSIDHHRDNPKYATYNWVDPSMSATALMVSKLAKKMNYPLEGDLGKAIYLGLVADTGSFSYANTDGRTLTTAAEIVKQGLDVGQFYTHYENTWSMDRFRFWGRLSNEVKLAHNGTIAYAMVSSKDLSDAALTVADLSDFSSWLRRIKGTRATALIREKEHGGVKISLRSVVGVNVQKAASRFGGGGHFNAAALEMDCDLEEALQKILPALIEEIDHPSPIDEYIESSGY